MDKAKAVRILRKFVQTEARQAQVLFQKMLRFGC